MEENNDPRAASEVFFDGGCPICRREIAGYQRLKGMAAVRWRDVSAEEAEGLDRAAALARFHVRRADGSMVSGAAAFLSLWRCSPRLAPIARLLDRAPLRQTLELGYRAFLRVRPLWRRA
jgi:predicted DCC family thiol-disulfide oxidoreductase YuxK